VYPGQPPLLFILSKESGLIQKDLAARLQIKPATLTVMLSRMEKAGLVTRHQDEEDQRISRVFITDKGRDAFKMAEGVMREIDTDMFKGFKAEERKILKEYLSRIRDNLITAGENRKLC
ncbi:MAG: MarR family transcriptional regulator, partial [Firmicutes bacterium]|nr:MarR family transcriptional regulator [Bacillota bacterium]